MKNIFPEFARTTPEEYKEQWKNSLIVFDTNVLLSLYYYSSETKTSILDTMEDIKERLWLPYQVGKEFYTNRVGLIQKLEAEPDRIVQGYKAFLATVPRNSCFYRVLSSKSSDIQKEILAEAKKNRQDIFRDKIADFIESVYDGRVGCPFTKEKCTDIDKEYKENVSNNIICPGFKDSKKKDNATGDFYIWKQILEKAKATKKNIIFVTDDEKEDWWWISGDKRISARHELKKEFYQETDGGVFHMYNLRYFLKWYTTYKGVKVDKKVEDEIKNYDAERSERMVVASELTQNLLDKSGVGLSNIGKLADLGLLNGLTSYKRMMEPYEEMMRSYQNLVKHTKIMESYKNLGKLTNTIAKTRLEYLAELLGNEPTEDAPELLEDTEEK